MKKNLIKMLHNFNKLTDIMINNLNIILNPYYAKKIKTLGYYLKTK